MRNALLVADNKQSLEVLVTENLIERTKGLFSADISLVDGLWITPCNSIHTFKMSYKIDLVYLNRMNKVIKLVEAIMPWRISFCLGAKSVIEMHAGSINKYGLYVGQVYREL